MKANELRIGNWINAPNLIPMCVKNIQPDYINRRIDAEGVSGSYKLAEFSGIPLTPEILLKFGFENYKNSSMITVKDCGFIEVENDGSVGVGDEDGHEAGHWFSSKKGVCKYVHQLQNLYFDLTGEELNYTP